MYVHIFIFIFVHAGKKFSCLYEKPFSPKTFHRFLRRVSDERQRQNAVYSVKARRCCRQAPLQSIHVNIVGMYMHKYRKIQETVKSGIFKKTKHAFMTMPVISSRTKDFCIAFTNLIVENANGQNYCAESTRRT